jgi:hypothetical protein
MSLSWCVAHLVLWISMTGLGALIWGAFRALSLLDWRLQQWEIATPRRRRGLGAGSPAPDFALRGSGPGRVRLRDLAGRTVLLVFADDARGVLPELRRLRRRGDLEILLVQNATAAARPPDDGGADGVPVVRQKRGRLARRYQVIETPFGFVIDARGRIAARGLVRTGAHLHYLLDEARAAVERRPGEGSPEETDPEPPARPLRDFRPRPDDIFIATYPRSGTTWTQMILYQLTTDGRMDFAHIGQVCPWFERSYKAGRDLDALPDPRVFKSHLPYRRIPRGPCRYIYVARDGKDVAVSYYHFYRSHMGYTGTFEAFYEKFLAGDVSYGSWLAHVAGWWAHRDDPNVLFLHYEDLVHDLAGSLRRIADFCGLDIAPDRFPGILERCGFAFMKAHESQFDPLLGMIWDKASRSEAHLRTGRAGGWKQHLSPEQEARFDRAFGRRLGRLGLAYGTPAAVR